MSRQTPPAAAQQRMNSFQITGSFNVGEGENEHDEKGWGRGHKHKAGEEGIDTRLGKRALTQAGEEGIENKGIDTRLGKSA